MNGRPSQLKTMFYGKVASYLLYSSNKIYNAEQCTVESAAAWSCISY